ASRGRHTRFSRDWSSDVCSSDLADRALAREREDRELVAQPAHGAHAGARCPRGGEAVFERAVDVGHAGPVVDRQYFEPLAGSGKSEERRVGKAWRQRKMPSDDTT